MVVPLRTGLSGAFAAALALSVPVLSGAGLRAEERINWLKTPAAAASSTTLPDTPEVAAARRYVEATLAGDPDAWRALAGEPGARVHLYGKSEARPGRKMGHVNRIVRSPASERRR